MRGMPGTPDKNTSNRKSSNPEKYAYHFDSKIREHVTEKQNKVVEKMRRLIKERSNRRLPQKTKDIQIKNIVKNEQKDKQENSKKKQFIEEKMHMQNYSS